MIKKIVISVFVCFLLINSYAWTQQQPKRILTEQDVINFAKNFDEIIEELENMDIDMDLMGSMVIDDILNAINDVESINKVLNKYGISNPEPFRKIAAMCFALTIEAFNTEIAKNPEVAVYLQMLGAGGDFIADMRKNVHPADLELVKKHYSKFEELLN